MRRWLAAALLVCSLAPAAAQQNVPLGPTSAASSTSPCSAFGTTAGTCAQGNDSRITGAAPLASPTFTGTPAAPTPSATDNSTTLATTAYVTNGINNAIAAVNPAVAVKAATTAASDTSALTYSNGVGGIGATLTGAVNTALAFDGVTLTSLNQRVLVKDDTVSPSGARNGVYYLTQLQTAILPPILTRALDYDQSSDINNTGAIPVVSGTVNASTSWLLTSSVTTVGTDALTYSKFSIAPSSIVSQLGQQTLPMVLVSSGTMGNNGALSGLTAVATAYPNAYCSLPAGAIATGVPAAQTWYYCEFSSTTAATVFNNTYTSGTPAIPGSKTPFATTGPGAYTQTTGSNIAGYTLAIPGNTLGLNGGVQVKIARTNNNSAGGKTVTGNYSTFAFATVTLTTGVGNSWPEAIFANRGSTNVQISGGNFGANFSQTPLYSAIDSTAAQNLVMNMQLGTATDTMTLESVVVELLPSVP